MTLYWLKHHAIQWALRFARETVKHRIKKVVSVWIGKRDKIQMNVYYLRNANLSCQPETSYSTSLHCTYRVSNYTHHRYSSQGFVCNICYHLPRSYIYFRRVTCYRSMIYVSFIKQNFSRKTFLCGKYVQVKVWNLPRKKLWILNGKVNLVY